MLKMSLKICFFFIIEGKTDWLFPTEENSLQLLWNDNDVNMFGTWIVFLIFFSECTVSENLNGTIFFRFSKTEIWKLSLGNLLRSLLFQAIFFVSFNHRFEWKMKIISRTYVLKPSKGRNWRTCISPTFQCNIFAFGSRNISTRILVCQMNWNSWWIWKCMQITIK